MPTLSFPLIQCHARATALPGASHVGSHLLVHRALGEVNRAGARGGVEGARDTSGGLGGGVDVRDQHSIRA
jgi:hypothetical protein